jgi:hypothetical protein
MGKDVEVDKYGRHEMGMSSSSVEQHANFFVFLKTEVGQPVYVGDVREWLKKVDSMGIPDSTEVEGSLQLSYDFNNTDISTITCGDCGGEDILTITHHCDRD